MADFRTPFANTGDKRFATPTEQAEGFPCGPAERALFNAEFYRLEAEVGEVIRYAGIVGTNDRMTQLREAINNLISAAIGVIPDPPDVTGFVLMSQARARLPIYPHIYGGYISPVSPGVGVCRVPGGITFLHRGIYPVTSAQQDLNTIANQIYHLRWRPGADPVLTPNGEFKLYSIGDVAYNPSGYPENSSAFDSTFDDMLCARVITNSSNAISVTALLNLDRMVTQFSAPSANNTGGRTLAHTINFSRLGYPILTSMTPPANARDSDYNISVVGNDRYSISVYTWAWQGIVQLTPAQMSSPGYTYTVMTP